MESLRQRKQIATRLDNWTDGQAMFDGYSSSCTQDQDPSQPTADAWDDYDSDLNPKNWPFPKKLAATLLVTAIAFAVQYASAVDSAVAEEIETEFGVGAITESLATGLLLVGFGIGAPVAGPLSEIAGRNPVYIVSLLGFMLSTTGAGLAPNIGLQLFFRLLAGAFGSTPLVCAGGTVSDLWTPVEQIHIFPIYATGAFLGISIGAAVGGIISESTLVGWRWAEWSTLILSGTVLLLVLLLQPETYAPVLLHWKAHMLASKLKGKQDDFFNTEASSSAQPAAVQKLKTRLAEALSRPIELAFSEPIIIMISVYLSLLYIVLFTLLPGYTFIFTDTYGFGPKLRGLSFLGLAVGFLLALALVLPVTVCSRTLIRLQRELQPKYRLYYAMVGAPATPISLFWMGWTTDESISPWSPIAASALLGFGVLCVFFSSYQYIIHRYAQAAASGLVFITLARYAAAGGMVVAGIPLYANLGVANMLSVLGGLSTLLAPIPFGLFWYAGSNAKYSEPS